MLITHTNVALLRNSGWLINRADSHFCVVRNWKGNEIFYSNLSTSNKCSTIRLFVQSLVLTRDANQQSIVSPNQEVVIGNIDASNALPQSAPPDARVHCKKFTSFGYQIASGMVSAAMLMSWWYIYMVILDCGAKYAMYTWLFRTTACQVYAVCNFLCRSFLHLKQSSIEIWLVEMYWLVTMNFWKYVTLG